MKLLSEGYPNHEWDKSKLFGRQKRFSQWRLYKILQEIFPNCDILEEYQFAAMSFNQTGCLMTFDIYVPSLNIVFEYQGYQHYHHHYMFGDVKYHKEHDLEKREACTHHSMCYLEVPYWWEHDKESVIAIINQARPDIVPTPVVSLSNKKSHQRKL